MANDIPKPRTQKDENKLLMCSKYGHSAFCAVGIWFGSSLWHAALTLQTAQPAESIAGEEFRPQVGDPPYRVVIDAGHGGADPGARGVIEEKI